MWPFGSRTTRKPRPWTRMLRARYDAAITNAENMRHWSNADGLSADASASPEVRRVLRNRSRYEVANNAYAKGIVMTLANDCIGTGPRLQLLSEDAEANSLIEAAFIAWASEIHLPAKLRIMRTAKAVDGEVFGMLIVNPMLRGPIKLDLQVVEADRVTQHDALAWSDDTVDGIEYDRFGNPVSYYVLRHYSGQIQFPAAGPAYERVDARVMLHWFQADRPDQHRGVPEITSALPLFAQLRRYTLAVLGAAETAADFAAVLFTDAPANGEAASVEPMDIVELEKRMATVLPDGWKLGQIKAEQPGTTYGEFKRELLNEIARCLNMPFNIAAGNSSGYNYASGRLDHQTYYKAIRVEQAHCNNVVLDPLFRIWLAEASRVADLPLLPGHWPEALEHQWFWDGTEHVDPAKEASAQSQRLTSHTTTLACEYARQGKDWETELRQRAKEKQLMKELGLDEVEARPEPSSPSHEEDIEDDDQRDAA